MAMSSQSRLGSGYKCEFVGAVPEELVCELCKHVAREAHVTSCCGETVCEGCITPALEDQKKCPICACKAASLYVSVTSSNERRYDVLALEVPCTMKDRGCEWTGKLEDLEAHLDVNTGDCEYVDVECPNESCNERFQKYDLSSHLSYYCPKREYTCQFCGFKGSYSVVHGNHGPQCRSYSVPCPNTCGEQAIERGSLDVHLPECSVAKVECEFNYAGCETKLSRQDMERHMTESAHHHLSLLSAKIKAMKEYQEQHRKRNTETIRELQKHAQICSSHYSPSLQISMFANRRKAGGLWCSPPLYTHPGGHKFHVVVHLRGSKGSGGGHISVSMDSLKGEFDGQLLWPANTTITLQLLNQETDQSHLNVTKRFSWPRPSKTTHVGFFSEKFISHGELSEFNPDTQTRYLLNDTVFFRVKVETVD